MRLPILLLASTLLAPLGARTDRLAHAAAATGPDAALPHVVVHVDSARHEVTIVTGPFHLASMPMQMHGMVDDAVFPFDWPVDGWVRGYRLELTDSAGHALDREMIHHTGLANFDRRMLLYPEIERLLGAGKETESVTLPPWLGVPLEKGTHLAIYSGLHNESAHDVEGAYVRLILSWHPAAARKLTSVLPFFVEVNNHPGGTAAFDLPPGRSQTSEDFEPRIGGTLFAVGAHVHDYATAVWIVDLATKRTLVRLDARRAGDGHVLSVARYIPGPEDEPLRLKANHRYRIITEYENPTRDTIPNGGMSSIAGPFIPDDMSSWPRVNRDEPGVQADIASLGTVAAEGGGSHEAAPMDMTHMDMSHPQPVRPDSAPSSGHGGTP